MVKKRFIIAFVMIIFILAACGKKEETEDHKERNMEEMEKESMMYQSPLTGIMSEEEFTGRAYAVTINNHPKARPQSGLHKADIIYELLAEGDITRFLAIFHSEQPDNIGPVRSARDYFIELAKGYNALYIAHGFSPEAKSMLERGVIDNINGMYYDGSLFKRSSSRVAPHNSYITSENVYKGAEKIGYSMDKPAPDSLTFLSEEEIHSLSGEQTEKISISYSSNNRVTYEYDASSEKYVRYTNGEKTIDLDSNEPVLLDNVFIVETNHSVVDSVGRRNIDLTSGGKGYLLQKGQIRQVEWKNDSGKILPYIDGKVAGFVPGKTWINFVPTNPGIESSVTYETAEQ